MWKVKQVIKKQSFDALVLGGGIVGVCAALQLQKRGLAVALVDRLEPGRETSYGNAGLIERSGLVPYGFPRDLRALASYALQRNPAARADLRYLPRMLPWLWRFWRESAPDRLMQAARDMLPLIERCVQEHEILMAETGMLPAMRKTGWIEAYRDGNAYAAALERAEATRAFGLRFDALDAAALQKREPSLRGGLAGALHWLDPATLADPGGLVQGYAAAFVKKGGVLARGDAATLEQEKGGWSVAAEGGLSARQVVLALGPWSDLVFKRLGYRFPLAVKRGYHLHFRPERAAALTHPIVDAEQGYVLAPMAQGIRMTTGVEFAARDSAPTPVQVALAERRARELFPLGEQVETAPWMGCRPCLPDMRPIIGAASRHDGLWFDFGHNHHGMTLGPVSGRLLAEMMTGSQPFTDPRPYAPERFGR